MSNQTHKVEYINNTQNGLNTYNEDRTLNSCVNTELENNSEQTNIKLLNYDDYIIDENGYKIYGHPDKWILDKIQEYNNCGIVSALNLLSIWNKKQIANTHSTENEITHDALDKGLCTDKTGRIYFDANRKITDNIEEAMYYVDNTIYQVTHTIDFYDGGTDEIQVQQIIQENNKSASTRLINNCSINTLANYIKQGYVAIVAVDSEILWKENNETTLSNHFITIIGVYYDQNDNLKGFYVCDSGKQTNNIDKYSVEDFQNAWQVKGYYYENGIEKEGFSTAIITQDIAKSWADDLDATGNDSDNIITGNNGDNILRGLGGDDIIFPGDRLQAIGSDEQLQTFGKALKGELVPEDPNIEEREMKLRKMVLSRSCAFLGKTLGESGIRDRYSCMVVGVEEGQQNLTMISPSRKFVVGDIIWVVGERRSLEMLAEANNGHKTE